MAVVEVSVLQCHDGGNDGQPHAGQHERVPDLGLVVALQGKGLAQGGLGKKKTEVNSKGEGLRDKNNKSRIYKRRSRKRTNRKQKKNRKNKMRTNEEI